MGKLPSFIAKAPDEKAFHVQQIEIQKSINTNLQLKKIIQILMPKLVEYKYGYQFSWRGIPIIKFPEDLIILQEIIFNLKPSLIIETGVARGGSLIFFSDILSLSKKNFKVIGLDIKIHNHTKKAIKNYKLSSKIKLFEGNSTDNLIIMQIEKLIAKLKKQEPVLLVLDSDHSQSHVLEELKIFCKILPKGSIVVVADTIIDSLPGKLFKNRPWGENNNPNTAMKIFLKTNKNVIISPKWQKRLLISENNNSILEIIK